MSAGVYVLEPGEQDLQQPHHEDEVYLVVEGEASISVADEQAPVRAGSAVFVPAEVPHHFHSITRRLTLFVFFAPAESGEGD
jgi:mannose-6-phosphate isomerase-like protein (cupin superfamily)